MDENDGRETHYLEEKEINDNKLGNWYKDNSERYFVRNNKIIIWYKRCVSYKRIFCL